MDYSRPFGDEEPMTKSWRAVVAIGFGSLALSLSMGGDDRAGALENGLGRTPPMGWNSWNKFKCTVTEAIVKGNADAIV